MHEHAVLLTVRLPPDVALILVAEAARLETTVGSVALSYLTGGAMASRIRALELQGN